MRVHDGGGSRMTLRAASTQWNGEIVMSDDAAVIALPFYSSGDKVALTRDGGATWQVLGGTQELWQSPSVSPDGSRVVASYYAYGGQSVSGTQWSDDYGQTFRLLPQYGMRRLRFASGTAYAASMDYGQLAITRDAGQTWTYRRAVSTPNWLDMVGDGSWMLAANCSSSSCQGVLSSRDEGRTWVERTNDRASKVWAQDNGRVMVSLSISGALYRYAFSTRIGTQGTLRGGNRDVIELQYWGGGLWSVISADGSQFMVDPQ
ncbi:MAG: hypothetical protein E6Q92_12460 [Burkholderiaceae bacterium]|nr:MAG: hypothetical protein E6Q92_12460 [Burkholderiaceae bacterium]